VQETTEKTEQVEDEFTQEPMDIQKIEFKRPKLSTIPPMSEDLLDDDEDKDERDEKRKK
jgi:hypothetical protein